nr:arabinan endo-1,5-alpha-l-arabinosidase a [Quercus suber]
MACSGICTDTHDPSLIRRTSDGTYFRFATGGGIPIYTSPSLTGPWTRAGTVLPNGSSINNAGAKDAWAPDVHYINGEYYLYYAVSTFGTQKSVIGVASSKSMDNGRWTDHGSTGVSSTTGDRYNAIDPNLLVVAGTPYLTFGSFWGDIYQTTLATNYVKTTGAAPYEIELNRTSPQPSEGAFVYPHGSYYYLFFSSGSCCGYDNSRPAPGNEYKIMVCRSSKVNSGYVSSDTRIFQTLMEKSADLQCASRSINPESRVLLLAALRSSARMARSTDQADRACTTIQSSAPCCTITMWTPRSGTQMRTSGWASTRSTSAAGGLWSERFWIAQLICGPSEQAESDNGATIAHLVEDVEDDFGNGDLFDT